MAYLNPNNFYSYAQKTKSGGSVPKRTVGALTPSSGVVGGAFGAPKPPAPASAPSSGGSASPQLPPGFTPQSSTLPPDPVYLQTKGGLDATLTNTVTGLQGDRQRGLAYYGYNEGTDGSLMFDPNNPYSQAALALKNYNQQKTGNVTSYAAAGQLYSGSLKNAQTEAGFQYGKSNDSILGALRQFLANNTTATNNAISTHDSQAGAALGQSIQNAPSNPLYSAFAAAAAGGAQTSYNPQTGEYAVTAANGPVTLGSGPAGTIGIHQGYTFVYDASGKLVRILDASGNPVSS